MQLADRIEKRRFVGREFLLWLWFESEVLEGTLHTTEHGSFGFWIERQLVLTSGKGATRITGAMPAAGREAKESLLRGKMPDSAGFHLLMDNQDTSFRLKAESLGVSGLKLPTVLDTKEEEAPQAILKGPKGPPKRRRESAAQQGERESDEAHEVFYERMQLTRDFESIVEGLYRDFLVLRLGDVWESIAAQIRAWATGEDIDEDAYTAVRDRVIDGARRKAKSRR